MPEMQFADVLWYEQLEFFSVWKKKKKILLLENNYGLVWQ